MHLLGRFLFGPNVTYDFLQQRLAEGYGIKVTKLTNDFDYSNTRQSTRVRRSRSLPWPEENGCSFTPLTANRPHGQA
jgi:hypothetical protein